MKELPILFTTEMIEKIIEGKKTQTRRVIKPQPDSIDKMSLHKVNNGDLFYVRESWRPFSWDYDEVISIQFKDQSFIDVEVPFEWDTYQIQNMLESWEAEMHSKGAISDPEDEERLIFNDGQEFRWRPGIHLPKAWSRLWLKVTKVRFERLNNISEEDAKAEGVHLEVDSSCYNGMYRDEFSLLWNRINGDRFPWKSNPWVLVYDFEIDLERSKIDIPVQGREEMTEN
ncbi:MAG: hypothetical protein AAF363_14415 [Bacteroidota bacterium]